MERYPGRFIVLEGLDGAGTTSQSQHLVTFFQQAQLPVHMTAEPSQGAIGQLIRKFLRKNLPAPSPLVMNLLFAADRQDHLAQEILPNLAQGTHVICDRYLLSSLTYQQVAGVSREFILSANQAAYPPDLTILLDVSMNTASLRRSHRDLAQELYEADPFLDKVASLYRKEAQRLQEEGQAIAILDGNGTKEEVFEMIQKTLQTTFVGENIVFPKQT